MTIIAAIKDYADDGGIYIGCDGVGSDNIQTRPAMNEKLWRQGGFLIGMSGSYRVTQVIRYQIAFPTHEEHISTDEYVHNIWVRAVIKGLQEAGCVENNNGLMSMGAASALIGYRNRLFTFQNNFSFIEEMDGIHAIGAGWQVCIGALKALPNKNPKKKLLRAMEITGAMQPGSIGAPYFVERL